MKSPSKRSSPSRLKAVDLGPSASETAVHQRAAQTHQGSKHFILLLFSVSLVFVLIVLAIIDSVGAKVNLFLDEGIYIHGAQRSLVGQVLYRDWFGFTGPGTFWLLAAAFRVLGQSAAVAHTWLAVEIGIVSASMYWAVAKPNHLRAAALAALTFAALLIVFPNRLSVNHRWDSLAFGFLAAVLISKSSEGIVSCCAGLLSGYAILCTPTVAGLSAVLGIFATVGRRSSGLAFVAGIAISLGLAVTYLGSHAALEPMLAGFRWASVHYQNANSVPFGYEPGNPIGEAPRSLFSPVPVLLPFAAAALAIFCRFRRVPLSRSEALLLASGAAMVVSCYPRWAANQLLFTVPFFVTALLMMGHRLLSARFSTIGAYAVAAFCLFALATGMTQSRSLAVKSTQLGDILCRPQDCKSIELATATIKPGQSLFVYPYQPILYSLTGGQNKTYFDFLQPGMMTLEDEEKELRELKAKPPDWIIWHSLPTRTVMAIWPNSDRSTLRFYRIGQFIRDRYEQLIPPNPNGRYTLAVFARRFQ